MLSIYILSFFSRAGQVSQNLFLRIGHTFKASSPWKRTVKKLFPLAKMVKMMKLFHPPWTEIANFNRNYFILTKVYTDEGVIK